MSAFRRKAYYRACHFSEAPASVPEEIDEAVNAPQFMSGRVSFTTTGEHSRAITAASRLRETIYRFPRNDSVRD